MAKYPNNNTKATVNDTFEDEFVFVVLPIEN